MDESRAPVRRQAVYRGTVQGVGFRYTARRIAPQFRVTGCVQNLSDGGVLVVAEGPPEEVERFLAAVREALDGLIDAVDEDCGPATGEFCDFSIRH